MSPSPIVCIGASLADLNFRCKSSPLSHTSNPAGLFKSPGGVIRNIAHHLAMLGHPVELITILGDDADGKWLYDICTKAGISMRYTGSGSEATGTFVSILSPEGELEIGAVAADINLRLDIPFLAARATLIQSASVVMADCNLSVDTLKWLISFCESYKVPLVIETVSVSKSVRLLQSLPGKILMVKPNTEEIKVFDSGFKNIEDSIAFLHKNGVKYVWHSKGEQGSILSDGSKTWSVEAPGVKIKDTTGAGDAATAGWIHAWLQNKDMLNCVRTGHALAAAILETSGAVRDDLSEELLNHYMSRK